MMPDIRDLEYVADAHTNHPTKPSKAFRKFDGKTPYYYHPFWCAYMIASEPRLELTLKEEGKQVLLYHDVLEDTTVGLPNHLSGRVKELVKAMTFESAEQEREQIWLARPEVRLYKLYDKVSNLIDSSWMDEHKIERYKDYVRRLRKDVISNYGRHTITDLADVLAPNPEPRFPKHWNEDYAEEGGWADAVKVRGWDEWSKRRR